MSLQAVRSITSELPWKMRTEIEGYLASVHAARFEIFREAGVRFDSALYDRFIFVVGLQRLWTLIDGSFWILNNSLSLLRSNDVGILEIGSTQFHYHSSFYRHLAELRMQLMGLLREQQTFNAVETRGLSNLLMEIE